jgi:hypothetical protein
MSFPSFPFSGQLLGTGDPQATWHNTRCMCGSWGQKFVESKSLRVEITPEAQLCRLAGNINKYNIGLYSIGWPVCAVVSRCQDWWRTGFVVPSIEVCFCQRRCKFAWTRQCMWKRYWFTMIYSVDFVTDMSNCWQHSTRNNSLSGISLRGLFAQMEGARGR